MITEQFVVDYQRAVQPSVGVGRGPMDSDAAVKYSADPDSHEPIGFPLPGLDPDTQHLPRFAAADYLRDRGRDEEADTVQTHQGPLIVHQGKVKKGQYTLRHVDAAHRAVTSHVNQWSGGEWYPDYDYVALHPDEPRAGGRLLNQAEFERLYHPADHDADGSHEYPDELKGRPHVVMSGGDHDSSWLHHLPYSEIPDRLADQIADEINGRDYGWNTDMNDQYPDEDEQERMGQEFDTLLHRLRTAPTVELHPSETSS